MGASIAGSPNPSVNAEKLAALEQRILSHVPRSGFAHEIHGLQVVKTALAAVKNGSGGIGACIIDTRDNSVVMEGRNRQYDGYFRSDLHAEMDLLNAYEDKARKQHRRKSGKDPRGCPNLLLISSMEPCPMCLTRIINSGIKTVLYVEEDPQGGMASRLDCLPPFWREFARDRTFKKADCSPEVQQMAHDLFHLTHRSFAKNRQKTPSP